MSKIEKTLFISGASIYFLFLVFSYSFVDLDLTLSQNRFVLWAISNLQQIAYYHRPISALIYITLLSSSFLLFAFCLYLAYKRKLSTRFLFLSTLIFTLFVIFAYPFLSSDLFNYMFDAKIITLYHSSPYLHRALDFPSDDWLRFMRWTHRYSPYGPIWLVISTIPSFLAFGKFILNFIAFKIFIGTFHIFNSLIIYKTLKKMQSDKLLLGTAFYALNPLFLIEGVVNAHNDIVLLFFILCAFYFLTTGKKIQSTISLIVGFFIKYVSLIILPLTLLTFFKKISFRNLLFVNFALLTIFTFIFSTFKIATPFISPGSTQVQFQPWYLFWTIPIISLLVEDPLIVMAIFVSFGAEIRYLPYLFYGDWIHPNTIIFMEVAILVPLFVSSVYALIHYKVLQIKK